MRTAKIAKLVAILSRRWYRSTLIRHRVAATTEHIDAIRFCAPATLIDVGANKGQFSTAVRGLFRDAVIHAFEPLPEAADRYEMVFAGDPRAHLRRVAIGAEAGVVPFYVTDRTDSSSLLRPSGSQKAAFGVGQAGEITVSVAPLDEVLDLAALPSPVLMKIDVQGAELDVLRGCTSLDQVDCIYVELSFVELYEHQALFEDVRAHLADRGFALRGVYNQVSTAKFGPTQADCLFIRA